MAQVELILLTEENFQPELFMAETGQEAERVRLTRLLGGYTIAVLEEEQVEQFLQTPGILYAELPTTVVSSAEFGRAASCINNRPSAPQEPDNLNGTGVLVGIIDSGIDYTHPDFCNVDGTTRIAVLWDQGLVTEVQNGEVQDEEMETGEMQSEETQVGEVQTKEIQGEGIMGSLAERYSLGTFFTKEQINEALEKEQLSDRRRIVPSVDLSGHGTHVAGIAAGNGRASEGRYRGVAFESELLVVKLAEVRSGRTSVSGTARLMEAVDFCIRYAMENNQPLALNLSYGTQEGAHNGRSLLETYLDTVSRLAKCVICVGTGNDGVGRRHAGGRLKDTADEIELAIEGREKSLELELWKNYPEEFVVELVAPSGEKTEFRYGEGERVTAFGSSFLYSAWGKTVRLGTAEVEGFWSAPTIYQNLSELRISITATGERLGEGIWRLRLIPERIVEGTYDIWILQGTESGQSGFAEPDSYRTLTIPSTAEGVVSVGAYDFGTYQVAAFSGRGTAREAGRMKPDLVAPGVDIMSCAPGGGYTARSGTSMATPFVTGGVALLLQWGVVNGNDPYLYGEKLREYLLHGAQRVAGEEYPNPLAGWGRLCVNDSLPGRNL